MIDTSKQYTYNGKPVRIYANGSDTSKGSIHGAVYDDNTWFILKCSESDLVEVWEPKEEEKISMTKETKEKFAHRISNAEKCDYEWTMNQFEEFFNSNVVIPRGENRKQYADELHAWIEGIEVEALFRYEKKWKNLSSFSCLIVSSDVQYRIKPSEPVWEYMYYDSEGKTDWLTEDEYQLMMDSEPMECYKALETKRERK